MRRLKVELTQAEARLINEALAQLDTEIEQNEQPYQGHRHHPGARGLRARGAIYSARMKLFDAGLKVEP